MLRGRRRIGKSFLLQAAFPKGRLVSYQADEQSEAGQLDLLAREASELLSPRGGAVPLRFPDWDAALTFFSGQSQDGAVVVILDEFQYLCRAQPALPSIIQRHWDDWERARKPVTLVLSGSAISFMDGLLTDGAPLFGRAGYRPLLGPIDYRSCAGFAKRGSSGEELVTRYGILGGTPQYQAWAGHRGVKAVIRDVILTKGAPLYDEPLQLIRFESDIRDPARYFGALRAVGDGATMTSEVANALGIDISNTAKLLGRLKALGYLQEVEPLAPSSKAKRARWRIGDPFFRFWFKKVFPNRSRLDRGRSAEVASEIERDLNSYVGTVFEDVCRDWLGRYAKIPEARTADRIGSWWSRDGQSEIDVVAMRKSRYVLLGTCKWTAASVGEAVLDDLYQQRAILGGPAAQARLIVFARRGFTPGLKERAKREAVPLVSARELFS